MKDIMSKTFVKHVNLKTQGFIKLNILCRLDQILSMNHPKARGGAKAGAGRPKKQSEKKQSYNVSLLASQKNLLVERYGTLSKALEELLKV